jgi:subtilisin family serine protease
MTNHSREHLGWRRQLLVMATVLLGAMLLLVGFLPPQVAQGKEQQQEQIPPTPPQVAQGEQQQEQNAAPPAPGTEQAQQEELILDKDPQGNEYVAGELLVTYEKGAFEKAKEEAPKKVGAKVKKDFPEIAVQHVSVPEVKNEKAKEARQKALTLKKKDLEQAPDVEAVDYNYVREGTMVPSDPEYAKQWALPKINAPGAWDFTRGSTSVKVAILDSGIDANHPDLKGKIPYTGGQKDFVNFDNDASDDLGHGTLVAGIEGASINNRAGVVGICPDCRLLVAKVLDQNNKARDSDVIDAINWASSNGANVINMSFGLGGPSTALETAVNNAWGKGAVLVAAAGNTGSNDLTVYPAAYPNVIAVAATDKDDKRAIYEWRTGTGGTYPYTSGPDAPTQMVEASNAGPWVDVAAPGKEILTTARTYYDTICRCYPANVATSWGTSMAAPHVSGLAGLLFSQGGMTNTQVRKKIEDTAKDLGTVGKDPVFGHGLINAQAALKGTTRTYEESDPAITYSGSWTTMYMSGASGKYVKYSTTANDKAKLPFTGTGVTWMGSKGPGYGRAKVYIDGAYTQIVDLTSSDIQDRVAIFTKNWATSGNHTIEIVVEGTSGRPRVNVDTFSVTGST